VRTDVIVPLNLDQERDYGNIVTLIARLRPGVTLGQAQAEATAVAPSLCWSAKVPQSCGVYARPGAGMQLRTLQEYISGRLRRALLVLWCAVGMILLIACVNLANLLLARTAAREKEFALRAALGACCVRCSPRACCCRLPAPSSASAWLGRWWLGSCARARSPCRCSPACASTPPSSPGRCCWRSSPPCSSASGPACAWRAGACSRRSRTPVRAPAPAAATKPCAPAWSSPRS